MTEKILESEIDLNNPFAYQVSTENEIRQIAGYNSKQLGYNNIIQIAGGCSTQIGGHFVKQSALYLSKQFSRDFSIQIAGVDSAQESGKYSLLIAGIRSRQCADFGSTLVCRYKNKFSGIEHISTLFVDSAHSCKWYSYNLDESIWFECY